MQLPSFHMTASPFLHAPHSIDPLYMGATFYPHCKLSYLHLQTLHRRPHCLPAACISPYRSLIYCGHPIIRPNCYGLDSTVSTTVYVFMLLFLLPILESLACMQYKSAWREYPSQVPSLTESPFCQWNKRNMCNKKCRVFSFDVSFPEWKKNLVRKISGEKSRYISQLDIWRAAEMWNFSPRSERRSRCPFIFLTYMNTIDLSIIASKFLKKVFHHFLSGISLSDFQSHGYHCLHTFMYHS